MDKICGVIQFIFVEEKRTTEIHERIVLTLAAGPMKMYDFRYINPNVIEQVPKRTSACSSEISCKAQNYR